MALFGVYMGASFAPNHKGMPQIAAGVKVDFLRRQVLTSRNIGGGVFMDHFMSGLNYQIEHHLFPSMARPKLARTAKLVREFCAEKKSFTQRPVFFSPTEWSSTTSTGSAWPPGTPSIAHQLRCSAGRKAFAGWARRSWFPHRPRDPRVEHCCLSSR